MDRIALASASPRRLDILLRLGFTTQPFPADIDESVYAALPAARQVKKLAQDKAEKALPFVPPEYRWILAADTLIELPAPPSQPSIGSAPALVLGKAADRASAAAMLQQLAGREHLVHTGLALLDRQKDRTALIVNTSSVRFTELTAAEMDWYLNSAEWRGVAGAYRIQGMGGLFISAIHGSYSGIMGLPIHEFYVILGELGFDLSGLKPTAF